MARITCPSCTQQLNVPDGARAVRCPACKGRIDLPAALPSPPSPPPRPEPARARPSREFDDEDRDPPRRPARPRPRGEDDEDDRPRRKSKAARGSPVRGVIPLGLFGPACLVLMGWAPFSGYGTALGMLVGALAILVAVFGLVSRYFKDPVLTERIGDPNGIDAHVRMLADAIPASFAHPRRIAGWVVVGALGSVVLVEAMCTAAFLKTMDEPPPGTGPNPPGQPGPPPAAAPAPKPPSNDEVVDKALADLGSKQTGVEWKALEELAKAQPNQRRAVVLQTVVPRLDASRDGVTRTWAVKVVGAWGGPDELPILLNLITGPNSGPREEAIRAVGRFRDPRAIPVLVATMPDFDAAQKALVEIGPAVEPHLLPFLGVQFDYTKQEPALKVLKEVGTAASVPHLQALVRLQDGIRSRQAQEALDAIAARPRKEPTPPRQEQTPP